MSSTDQGGGKRVDSCETANTATTRESSQKRTPSSGTGSGLVRLLGLGGQGCRGMGWPPSLGLTSHFYLVITIGNVIGVTENWIATGFCPALSFKTKAAPIPSTVHAGGTRLAPILIADARVGRCKCAVRRLLNDVENNPRDRRQHDRREAGS
jgi:hypothetical protein